MHVSTVWGRHTFLRIVNNNNGLAMKLPSCKLEKFFFHPHSCQPSLSRRDSPYELVPVPTRPTTFLLLSLPFSLARTIVNWSLIERYMVFYCVIQRLGVVCPYIWISKVGNYASTKLVHNFLCLGPQSWGVGCMGHQIQTWEWDPLPPWPAGIPPP